MNEEILKPSEKVKMTSEKIKEIQERVKRAELLATVLDDYYLDPIVGALLPEGGDAATALVGLYIVYEAQKAGMSGTELAKMVGRTGLDFLFGGIPIAGDIFDFFFKSNKENAAALRKHFERISAGQDITDLMEGDLVEKERRKEQKDLRAKSETTGKTPKASAKGLELIQGGKKDKAPLPKSQPKKSADVMKKAA